MKDRPNAPFVIQVKSLDKSFPGVQALDAVRLEVKPGEVHALMGENGAGKSTLMKVLAGLHSPDGGVIQFQGRPVNISSPHEALRMGIAMIHQELMPFRSLTVAENIFMGQEPTHRIPGWIDQRTLNQKTQNLLDRLGVSLSPARLMGELSVAEMQVVEIAKALAHEARVIIMDEPTSAISDRESEALFAVIEDLKTRGVAVIYVSHKIEEVFRVADRITILRDGRYIGTYSRAELDPQRLISLMVGRELKVGLTHSSAVRGRRALEVRGLTRSGKFQEIHFKLRHGEILGIAGLMGAGRTELLSALFGLAPADGGKIYLKDRWLGIRHPQEAIDAGLFMVSEDRQEFGLVTSMNVAHNLTLSSLAACCQGPFINRDKENRIADDCLQRFAIKARHRGQRADTLSGGNQQKVVIAKALLTHPTVLLLDEPTRGIDVGAKEEIYRLIRELAREGMAILMASSELPEILALSHRILVMCEGRITAELDPQQTNQAEILKYAMPG